MEDKIDEVVPFVRCSNVELCLTLFYLTNVAHANNDDEGVKVYTSTMTSIIKAQKFSGTDTKMAMTQLFILYGSKKPKTKPGLIRLNKPKKTPE